MELHLPRRSLQEIQSTPSTWLLDDPTSRISIITSKMAEPFPAEQHSIVYSVSS